MTADTLDRALATLADLRNADMAREPWMCVADVAAALIGLASRYGDDGGCWCEAAIGNPMCPDHSANCKTARAAISRLAGDA